MIPRFPEFKSVELGDKASVDSYTERYGTYSDFEFGSLWAWNVGDDVELSELNENLVIRFADYQTGEPFLMFIGNHSLDETADELIAESKRRGYGDALHLIPEVSAQLDSSRFLVQEVRDHFDYVYELSAFMGYAGAAFKSQRNFLNGFRNKHPNHQIVLLDLSDPEARTSLLSLFARWEGQKDRREEHERLALTRFVEAGAEFRYLALGVYVDTLLVAFSICDLLPGTQANALFGKTDTSYHGIGAYMMHELAKELADRGYTHLNYQQDLGIEGLRKSKTAFRPVHFLKKYTVKSAVY